MKRRILVLAANPKGTQPLRLDEEVREIQAGLLRCGGRAAFDIQQAWAVRPRDVRRALLDYKPDIVHFCGHGSGEEGLVLENDVGQSLLVSAEALSGLFELFADQVRCVVLNACYSETQGQAIAQHIDTVVGMRKAIGDRAAIEFSIGFYDAIAASKPPAIAFRFGCNAIHLVGLHGHLTPSLMLKSENACPASVAAARGDLPLTSSTVMRGHTLTLSSFQSLLSGGRTVESVLQSIIKMDYENIVGLDETSEGDISQWVQIAENNPDGYAFIVTPGEEIVGYWHFEALQNDFFKKALSGELEESEISIDKTRFLCTPGEYDIYFIIFAVAKQYRGFKANRMLLEAFLSRLEEFAEEGILVRNICANAFTLEGIGLCRSLGMQHVRSHRRHGEIYFMDLREAHNLLKLKPRLLKALSAVA